MTNRATQAECLEQRIAENRGSQAIDLENWIFERVPIKSGDRVLELCCGTGGQTLRILESVGKEGGVAALDVSADALRALAEKAGERLSQKLTLIEASLDGLADALRNKGFRPPSFDLIFCAYCLYYAREPQATLEESLRWLNAGGRIVVVGPFGPNNKSLFDLVRACGVTIAAPVVFSSEQFMWQTVLPWGTQKFESVRVSTMVNPVRWTSKERVVNYWKNTTFYDAARQSELEARLDRHFAEHGEFVNEKWVMMVEMENVRP